MFFDASFVLISHLFTVMIARLFLSINASPMNGIPEKISKDQIQFLAWLINWATHHFNFLNASVDS